jgi:hypothetical protein
MSISFPVLTFFTLAPLLALFPNKAGCRAVAFGFKTEMLKTGALLIDLDLSADDHPILFQ